MPGKDVAPNTEAMDLIRGETLIAVEDSEQAQYAIAEQILRAETLADAFAPRKSQSARELLGLEMEVSDFVIKRSTLEGKDGNYLLVSARTLHDGRELLMNTGAPNIVALLMRVKMADAFPVEVMVAEAAPARPPHSAPLTLRPVGRTLAEFQATAVEA